MSDAVVEVSAPTLAQKVAAEVLGTFVLVLFGVGAAKVSGGDYVATGLSFGLAVLVMAYAVGRISGGHFNPAVSLGAAVGGRISWRDAGIYMAAQVGGAIVAALTLFVVFHGHSGFDATGNMGQNGFGVDYAGGFSWWAALIVELVMTAIFVVVILAVTDVRNEHPSLAPMVIGLSLSVIHFASMGVTGTSVNPARSIGPALFAGGHAIAQLWLFILAPLLGALLAGVAYHLVFGRADEPVPGSGLRFSRTVQQPAYPSDAYQQQWNQGYPQQQWAQQGYPQQGYPAGQGQPQTWEGQSWEGQGWEGQHAAQDPQQAQQPQTWEGQSWEAQSQTWQQQPPQPATQQPWTQPTNQPMPPAPSEPYWSQQLPENWDDTSGETDEGGHTQIRPPERS